MKKALLYGFFIWLIPFIVAVLIFPIHESNRIFFESIMPVVVTLSAVLFSVRYFRSVESNFISEGVKLGALWFGISIVIDFFMFSSGPMKMPLSEYVMDIGFTYLIIPAITIGFGYLLEKK